MKQPHAPLYFAASLFVVFMVGANQFFSVVHAKPEVQDPLEIGPDGRGSAWVTLGDDEALLTVASTGEMSFLGCPHPVIISMATVTTVDCGKDFKARIAQAMRTALNLRSRPTLPKR